MKPLKTAPQILEHYVPYTYELCDRFSLEVNVFTQDVLKAMRHYARVKSDKAYEEGYQEAINQMK